MALALPLLLALAAPAAAGVALGAYGGYNFTIIQDDSDHGALFGLKAKIDAGEDYIVTQMFFENRYYFEFVELCRSQGIEVPIIPGLKIISSKRQLRLIPRTFHCNVPTELSDAIDAAKPEEVIEVGVEWSLRQTQELIDKGVPALHFFIMQSSKSINSLLPRLKL